MAASRNKKSARHTPDDPGSAQAADQAAELAAAQAAAQARELSSLVQAAADGDAEAWRDLVERYSKRVFALLVSQCRDADLAEELTQQAFVKVVQKLGDYEDQGKFEPWLFRVAMNGLRDEMRRRKRQARPMGQATTDAADAHQAAIFEGGQVAADSPFGGRGSDGEGALGELPLDQLDRAEQVEQLKAAITTLSEADQQILQMRHIAGMSFPDIAASLEQPLGTVLARGHRVLKKLRRILETDEKPAKKSGDETDQSEQDGPDDSDSP